MTDFDFYSDYMSEENRNNFIEKFGSKLISYKFSEFCEKAKVFLSSMKINQNDFTLLSLSIDCMSK